MRGAGDHRSGAGGAGGGTAPACPLEFPASDAEVRVLDNGLEVVLKRDAAAPVASVQAWVRSGSFHEGDLLGSGLSHLVEHLVFKGTGKRDSQALARDVQDAGGYLNAYTSFDRTVYWVDVPKGGAGVAVDVVADLVWGAVVPEGEFEREKDVIRREIEMGRDDPGRASSQLMLSTVFRSHPFREPVIGHRALFDRLDRDDALRYYRGRYVPNNVFFVVAGDIDPDAVFDQLQELAGDRPRGFLGGPPLLEEPEQLGRRVVHDGFATDLSRFSLAWRIPGVTHPDMAALDVLASVLGTGRSSRLFSELRERQSLVHGISAYAYTPACDGVFVIAGDCDPGERDRAADAAREVVAALGADGPSPAELAKAQKGALADQFHTLVTARGQASDAASNWLLARNLDFTRDYVHQLEQVTAGEVATVARRYLRQDRETYTSLNPRSGKSEGRAAAAPAADPPVEQFELSNGLKVVLRDDHRLPLVNAYAVFLGGLLAESDGTAGLTQLCASTMVKGTSRRSAAGLMEEVEGVGGGIGSAAGNNSFAVSLGVMAPDTGLGLDVLGDVLGSAAFAPAEVDRERTAQLAALKREEDHLLTVATKELRRRLFAGHAYARTRTGSQEALAALGPAGVEAFAREHVTASNGVLALFGALPRSGLQERLEEVFGGLPAGGRAEVHPPAPPASPGGEYTLDRDKEQAVLTVGFQTSGVHGDDRYVLDLIDEACSDMASRLFVRIREELGLAYYVGASRFVGLAGGAFQFYLGTSPENLAKAEAELTSEISLIAGRGLGEAELERAKKTYLGKTLLEHQSNASLAQTSALDTLFGLGHDHFRTLADRVGSVRHGDVAEVAARVFGGGAPVTVRVVRGGS